MKGWPWWSTFSWGCMVAAPIVLVASSGKLHPAMSWWFAIHGAVVLTAVFWRGAK